MSSTNSTTSTAPRRAIGYCRISKDRDNETSTTSQEHAIRSYCAAHGWDVVDVVVENGRSAYKDSRNGRPGLKKARSMIEAGAADVLVAWKLDRVARNTRDVLDLVEELDGHGARFVSVTEGFDTTTGIGEAMLTIVAALARLESRQKSDRTTSWHEHRRSTAAAPAAQAPRGYCKPARNTLAIDPVEGPLIRSTIDRLLDGASLRSQVSQLAEHGVVLTQSGLLSTLTSPTIAGLVEVGDGQLVEGSWDALVEREQWEQLRAILSDPKRTTNHSAGERRYTLPGIAQCFCAGQMRVKNHPGGTRLVCRVCEKGIRNSEVETFVTDYVLRKLDDRTWRRLREQGRGRRIQADEIESRLAELWEMVTARELPIEQYRLLKKQWEGELAAAESAPLDLPDVESVRKAWPSMTVEAKRLVFKAVIESLVIGRARIGAKAVDESRIRLALVG